MKVLRLLLLWSALTGVLAAGLARADEEIGAFLVMDEVTDALILAGEITDDTPLDFRRAMEKRPAADTLILTSTGGDLASALVLARDVQARGLSTFIPADLSCLSACAYVFLAGRERVVEGRLGVHQMPIDAPDVSAADVLALLGEVGAPAPLISALLRTPTDKMYVFTPAEIVEMGINRVAEAPPGTAGTGVASGSQRPPPTAPGMPENRLVMYEGIDFYGDDISQGRAENVVECTRACLGDRTCEAFTYNANPKIRTGPNCFLKVGVGRLEAYADAISGFILRDPDEEPQVFSFGAIDPTRDVDTGINYPGNDVSSRPARGVSSLGECRQACIRSQECKAFSYRSSGQQCWLKDAYGAPRRQSGWTSGVKRYVNFEPTEIVPITE